MTLPRLALVAGTPKRAWVPLSVRRSLWVQPCAVCGVPWDIHVDHIVPVASGGGGETENLQPLCSGCNYIKGKRRTNSEVGREVALRGLPHFLRAGYKHATRYVNSYDGPGIRAFASAYPREYGQAVALFEAFVRGQGR